MKKLFLIIMIAFNLTLFGGMIKPIDNSSISYTHVLFEWEQVADAVDYEIQISTTSSFSSILSSETVSSLIYIESENIAWSDTYYWRVRPVYNDQTLGDWLDTFLFTTSSSITSADITVYDSNEYQDGVTFVSALEGNFTAAFDKQGDEIWNSKDTSIIMYNTNFKGELYGCHYDSGLQFPYPAIEFNLDGDYIWEESNEDFSHHDMVRLPDGNYLSIVEVFEYHSVPNTGPWYQACASIYGPQVCNSDFLPWIGDKVVIWDKDSKEIIWEWNAFDHYSIEDYDGVYFYDGIYGGTWGSAINDFRYDWTHMNAVAYSEEESAIYVSSRHLSRITKIAYPSGDIIWNMGQEMPSGDVNCGTDPYFSWQHSISVLDNGNIIILDNGNLSDNFNSDLDNPISRALEINPNELNGDGCNANTVWEHTLPEYMFGHASGGVQKLDNGNYLISTVGDETENCSGNCKGVTIEVSEDHNIVWEANYNLITGLIHRAYRTSSLYPVEVSAIASNYTDINGEPMIEVSATDSVRASFYIYNNGSVAEDFEYMFSSSSSDAWYEDQGGIIGIEAGGYELVNFSGMNSGSSNYNDIELVVSSVNNHNIVKTYTFTVYEAENLSNGIEVVQGFNLLNIYPNPFNPSTTINIQIDKIITNAEIEIYDINGQFIDKIYSGSFNPGSHNIIWSPKNIASGKYFIKFNSDDFTVVKEALYIK